VEVEKEIAHRRTERQNRQSPKERSKERVDHHANQMERNLHNQAATSHKFRHERHRVRIPATP
jgi:hypothetical protein